MQLKSDAELLHEYAELANEDVFAEIVQRHTDLVYSVILRHIDSPAIASEITQKVFIALAQAAKRLSLKFPEHASFAGWLCRCARNISTNFRRNEACRCSREKEAMDHMGIISETGSDWERLRPLLEEAMAALNETDHDAVVMRFFKKQDLRSIGHALGATEDTAQKRVSRALEKLKNHLARRGISTTAACLSFPLSANAIQAAPVGLPAIISAAAFANAKVSTFVTTAKLFTMTATQKSFIAATLAILAGTTFYEMSQTSRLRRNVQTLQSERAPLSARLQQLERERTDAESRFASMVKEIARLKEASKELLRLRAEITQLRPLQRDVVALQKLATSSSNLATWKTEELANAGRATPQDALQTFLWSAMTTNKDELARSIVADIADPESPSGMLPFGDKSFINLKPSDASEIRIISQTVSSPTEVQLEMQGQIDANLSISKKLTLRIAGDEWKLVAFELRDETGEVTGLDLGTRPIAR